MKKNLKNPFQVPVYNQLSYFLIARKWLAPLICGLLVVIIGIIVAYFLSIVVIKFFPSITPLFDKTGFVGLFGTLLGTILGAIIGGYLSQNLQKQKFRGESLITKKREIYEPLFNSLTQLEKHLCEDSYPRGIYTTHITSASPRFNEWVKIKNDSRSIQVPRWISNIFDQYVEDLQRYSEIRSKATQAVIAKLIEILERELKISYTLSPSEKENTLQFVLEKDRFCLPRKDNLPKSQAVEICDVDYLQTEKNFREECMTLPQVRELIKFYDEKIIKHTEWLKREISKIIWYINLICEMQDDRA